MKSRYVSLRKNPAGSPENKKISYPGKGTRFGKHLFITCLKIEFTLCYRTLFLISCIKFLWFNEIDVLVHFNFGIHVIPWLKTV